MNEFRLRLALQEIVRIQADPNGRQDSTWLAALAAAGLGVPSMREAEEHFCQLVKEAPLQSRMDVPPPDGIGHLTITMTYNSISREEWFSDSHFIRVHPGPICPKRTILRGRVQLNLDGILDQIEQCETSDADAG
jgi:hypothetical protein